MTSVPIEEQLGFDISGALQGIGQIDDALSQVVTQFQVGLASALETLTSAGADVTPLADSLDVAGLGPAIDTALAEAGSAPVDVTVGADTTPLTEAIDTATAITPIVDVGADTTEATNAIDALAGVPVDIPVTADTVDAENAIESLGATATSAIGSSGEGLVGLEGAVLGLQAATGLAEGKVGGLASTVSLLGGNATLAVAGGAVFTAFLGETVQLAADAAAQQARFNTVFGASASIVESIHVGGLNTSLEELGKKSGTTLANLENAASRIGQLGVSSGAAKDEVAGVAQQILGLGATLSVQNPRLGDAADVSDRLFVALTRGGRAAQSLGLDVPTKQIASLAQEIAGAGNEVTQFDKLQAGLQIALQGTGDTLGTAFAQGAQNAQVQLRALKTQIEETLVAIGQPLLTPVTDSLKDLLPVVQEIGLALGELAQGVIPILVGLAPALEPLAAGLGIIGKGLGLVADGINLIPAPVIQGLAVGFVALGVGIDAAAGQLGIFGLSLDFALGPIGILLGALAALGIATHIFGGNAHEAAAGTAALDDAFKASSNSATGFAGTLDNLNPSIEQYLKTTLEAGDAGKRGLDTANALGVNYKQIATALGGTDAQYARFRNNLERASAAQGIASGQSQHFFDILEEGRGTLEASASAALQGAVQSGTLSAQQLLAAQSAHTAAGFQDDYGHAIVDWIGVAKDLAPTIDAATQATNENAVAASTTSQAYAELVGQFATGAISVDTFTTSLAQFGFVGDGAATQAKAVSDALDHLLTTSEGALPTIGGAIDAFAATVKSDWQKVVDDTANGTGNVEADLKKLADDQDPQRFAENLDTQTANILGFTANLASLVNQGFGTLAASLAEKGPEAAGGLAAALASDPAKAKTAQGAEVLSQTVTNQLDVFLRSHFPQLQGLGGDAANQIVQGITGTLNKDGSVQTSILTLTKQFVGAQPVNAPGVKVAVPKPDVEGAKAAGEQTGAAAQTGFTNTFKPAAAATAAVQQVPPAIVTGMQPAIQAATNAGVDVTAFFAGHLHFGGAISTNMESIPGRIARASALNNLAAAGAGFELGLAYGEGFAGGISGAIGIAAAAAAELAAAADKAARKKLGIASPSKAGQDLGRQYVAGIVQGLSELDPLHAATAALTLALVPDLRPALRQTPSLAPGIVAAAVPTPAARLAGAPTSADAPASTRKDVSVRVDLHKVDVDPKHLSDEIAWAIQ